MLESNFSTVAGLICCNFIKKRLLIVLFQHPCFPVKFAKFLRSPFFHRTLPVAASVFIRSTHALHIKMICRDSGTDIFLLILV